MANFNTKKQMIDVLATKKGISPVESKEIIEDVIKIMEELIMDEEHDGLDIHGFAKFEVKEVPARERRNPKDGTTFISEAHNSIKAKMSSRIKKAVR